MRLLRQARSHESMFTSPVCGLDSHTMFQLLGFTVTSIQTQDSTAPSFLHHTVSGTRITAQEGPQCMACCGRQGQVSDIISATSRERHSWMNYSQIRAICQTSCAFFLYLLSPDACSPETLCRHYVWFPRTHAIPLDVRRLVLVYIYWPNHFASRHRFETAQDSLHSLSCRFRSGYVQ